MLNIEYIVYVYFICIKRVIQCVIDYSLSYFATIMLQISNEIDTSKMNTHTRNKHEDSRENIAFIVEALYDNNLLSDIE